MKCTFKRHPKHTGLSSVGSSRPNVDIKVAGKVVGLIVAPNWPNKDGKWRIRIAVKRFEGFKWVHAGVLYDTEEAARLDAPSQLDLISAYYEIHSFQD